MEKSAEAFRTISEVADLLETPAHVLRFWESRFPQIRPVKRAGGRRYYRPSDIALLTGIKRLLHDDGLTIRGVQKVLREQGIRYVADLPQQTGGSRRLHSRAEAETVSDAPEGPAEPGPDGAEHETVKKVTDPRPAKVVRLRAPPPAASSESTGASQPELTDLARLPTAVGSAGRGHDAATDDPEPPAVAAGAPDRAADPLLADPLPLWAAMHHPTPAGTASPSAVSPAGADPPTPEDGIWVPALLRAMPPSVASRQQAELLALYDRLALLRDRVARAAEAPRH